MVEDVRADGLVVAQVDGAHLVYVQVLGDDGGKSLEESELGFIIQGGDSIAIFGTKAPPKSA